MVFTFSTSIAIASKMYFISFTYLVFVLSIVFCYEDNKEITVNESLLDQDGIADLQEEPFDLDDPQIVTKEKTVYVTLNPTTVYVTVTEGAESSSLLEEDATSILSPSKSVLILIPTSSRSDSTENMLPTKNSIVVVTKTEIEHLSLTKVLKHVSTETKSNFEVTTSMMSSYFFNTTTTTTRSSSLSSTYDYVKFTQSLGELNLLLGDRQKDDKDSSLLSPTISSDTEVFTIQPISVTGVVEFPVQTSATSTYKDHSHSISTRSKQTWTFEMSDGPAPTFESAYETSKSSTLKPQLKTILLKEKYNTVSYTNQTGLEHLFENFRPYTDLPTANYTLTNSGNLLIIKRFTIFILTFLIMFF